MSYFELRIPRDMYQKAERELLRLRRELSIDNVFNFFVTAYHVQDYVRKGTAVPQGVLEEFLADQDLRDCRDLCDKGKHLRLTQRDDPTTVIWDGTIGGAPIGMIPVGGGEVWVVFLGDRQVEVESLAERVVEKWRKFLDENGL